MTVLVDSVELPDGMQVKSAWPILLQTSYYSGDGTCIIQQCAKNGGQPIVISSAKNGGWYGIPTYALVKTLLSMVTTDERTLSIDGTTFNVVWDNTSNPIDYEFLYVGRSPVDADPVSLTLRFLTLPTLLS